MLAITISLVNDIPIENSAYVVIGSYYVAIYFDWRVQQVGVLSSFKQEVHLCINCVLSLLTVAWQGS